MATQKNKRILIITYLLILLLNGLWGFWWVNLILGFIVGYLFFEKPRQAFKVNFLIIFFMWGVLSVIKDRQVGGIVSAFLSSLVNDIPAFLFYVITALLGGILTGWSASLGSQLRVLSKVAKS